MTNHDPMIAREVSAPRAAPRAAAALWLMLGTLWAAPSGAEPEEPPDYSRTGVYGAASYAYTPSYKGQSHVSGVNGRLGYRFTQGIAGEVEFEWLNPSDYDLRRAGEENVDSFHISANLKVYPTWETEQLTLLEGRLQPFFNFGAGAIKIDPKRGSEPTGSLLGQGTRFAARLGAGGEYYYTEHIVFVAEGAWKIGVRSVDSGISSDIDYGVFTFGLQYRF